jgi:hypothetical protein
LTELSSHQQEALDFMIRRETMASSLGSTLWETEVLPGGETV